MLVLTGASLLGSTADLGTETVRLWAFALAYVGAGRLAWYWSQQRARVEGESVRPTLIVGAGRVGALVAKRFLDNPELGFRPVAFLDKEPLVDTVDELGIPVAGASWDLDEAIARFKIEQVVITFSTAPDEVLLRIVRRCEDLGIPTAIVPRLFERMPALTQMEHLGGLPLVAPRPASASRLAVPREVRPRPAARRGRARRPLAASSSPRRSRCSCRWEGRSSSGSCESAATDGRSRC